MTHLAFPFWTLRANGALVSVEHETVAFSSAERATAYFRARRDGSGELKLVSRQSMRRLIVEIQQQNLTGIRLDPVPDCTDGVRISISDLVAEFSP